MSRKISLTATIPMDFSGVRIDAALAKLFPQYSRALLTSWLKLGHISIDGQVKKPKDKCKGGEQVIINAELVEIDENKAQDIALEIIFEDDELLVINKPAGLVVHPAAGNPDSTLVNALLFHRPDLNILARAGIVHRLDKDTTGLMLIAKTVESHTRLVQAMQQRLIKRCYTALVHGIIVAPGTVDAPLARHPKNRLKQAVINNGKHAITHYKPIKKFERFTLLEVQLETGRTHQIRVHMQHINHPIVGCPLYGRRMNHPQFNRQALHAHQLTLMHKDRELVLNASLPYDFQELLNTLEQENGNT